MSLFCSGEATGVEPIQIAAIAELQGDDDEFRGVVRMFGKDEFFKFHFEVIPLSNRRTQYNT